MYGEFEKWQYRCYEVNDEEDHMYIAGLLITFVVGQLFGFSIAALLSGNKNRF